MTARSRRLLDSDKACQVLLPTMYCKLKTFCKTKAPQEWRQRHQHLRQLKMSRLLKKKTIASR